MFQPILTDSLMTDPPSPQEDTMSVFSFYIREPSGINPFNPSSVSTPRKSHHVSMPALPAKTSPEILLNLSLDTKKKRKSAPLQKSTSLRPYLIRVQSNAGSLEDAKDTLCKEFTKPSTGRRSSRGVIKRTRAEKMRRGGVFRLKICAATLMRKLSCRPETSDDSVRARQRAYYFV